MGEKKVIIQRGFVLGFLAIGAVTIASGVILAISGQSITADISANAPTGFTEAKCTNGCPAYFKKDDLPESDLKKFFPSGITKSYIYIPSGCGALSEYRNRLVINVADSTNPASAELKSGDKVNFTILVQNTLGKQISYKKFIPRLIIANGSTTVATLNFYPGVEYLKINPNGTWKKTQPYILPSNISISDLKVSFVTYWGSGAYCGPLIPEAITLSSTDVSPTPTTTATSTATPSGSHIISLKAGYNAIVIPESWGNVEVNVNQAPSVTIFDYNWLGDKAWRPSNGQKVVFLTPGMGYYIYTTKAMSLYLNSYSATAVNVSGAIAMPGWTLLANSLGRDLSIANDKITAYKSGAIIACRTGNESACAASEMVVESKTIKEMIQSEKAYNTLYIVQRDDTNDPNLVFDIKSIDSSNIDSITIPKDKIYWIYTGSNKWYE